jgi:hypothetical protein
MPGRILATLVVGLVACLQIGRLDAQSVEDPLPVTGSLIYNALFLNRVYGTDSRGLALRFGGRVALRAASKAYVGLGGGSWIRVTRGGCGGIPDCEGFVTSQSEAIVYQLYLQHYLGRTRLFLRGGAGLGETRTLFPENRVLIAVSRMWRGAVGAGGGIDLRIARYLYLTPSLDFTTLVSANTRAEELGSALALGLALTLH